MKPVDAMSIEELRDEVAWRRAEMSPATPADETDRVRVALGLTPAEARVALAIRRSEAKGVSVRQLIAAAAIPGAELARCMKTADVHVSRIRAKAGAGMIETVSRRIAIARRYVATPALCVRIDAALNKEPI